MSKADIGCPVVAKYIVFLTGYIQTELMTCDLSRKCKNLVLFQENI